MRKRLRKKVSKYKCLKCGSRNGVVEWHITKKGKWVSGPLGCFCCPRGITRKQYEQEIEDWSKTQDCKDFMKMLSGDSK